MTVLLLNFSHPLTDAQRAQVEARPQDDCLLADALVGQADNLVTDD